MNILPGHINKELVDHISVFYNIMKHNKDLAKLNVLIVILK